ncbi:PH domain-containing protein [Arthrobacter zhaoguopingii]|uniref:PH domain-containing protein n=1 Tax=Arthrobacter zhaoguopingii TaxID=2681491 RepID=UPI001FECC708|nr:PH domain-containing protein [Arthrobacter zhaoguopingii]
MSVPDPHPGTPYPGPPRDGADPAGGLLPGAPPAPVTVDDSWRRVSVISPLVRGWIALAAIAFFFGRDWFEGLFGPGAREGLPGAIGIGLTIALILGIVVLIALGFLVSWYFTRYQVTAEYVRVNSGVLFRQNRQARLDRVQAIDVVQPFLARIFGLAELKFEVADAGESAVRLAFLRLSEAQQLRATILARASGAAVAPDAFGGIAEAPEREVVAVPSSRVIGAVLLSGTTVLLLAAVIVVATVTVVFRTPFAAPTLIPMALGVAGAYWSALNSGYNFRAALSPDGIRVRYGLLDTRAQTVPPGRVQAVGIDQPLLWRLKGWYRINANVAGYGAGAPGEGQARATLLPVGTRAEVFSILALVLPDPGTVRPLEVFSAGLDASGAAEGFTTAPRRARWLAPLTWRRSGFAVTGTALLVRSGYFHRRLAVVPHERTQSLSLHQGPLERALRVMELQLQTTPGPVAPSLSHIDETAALELFSGQARRAAEARRRSIPEQWMRPIQQPSGAVMPPPPSYGPPPIETQEPSGPGSSPHEPPHDQPPPDQPLHDQPPHDQVAPDQPLHDQPPHDQVAPDQPPLNPPLNSPDRRQIPEGPGSHEQR